MGRGREAEGEAHRIYALRFRIGTSGSPNASTSTSWRTAAGFSVTVDDEAVTGDLLAVAALSRYARKRTNKERKTERNNSEAKQKRKRNDESLSAYATVTKLRCQTPRCGGRVRTDLAAPRTPPARSRPPAHPALRARTSIGGAKSGERKQT